MPPFPSAQLCTVIGTIHRSWGDIKAKLGGTDRDLVETACQESAVQSYKLALEKQLLLTVRQMLLKQQAHVAETLEYLQVAAEGLVLAIRVLFRLLGLWLVVTHGLVERVSAGVFRMLGHHFLDGLTWWLRLRTVSGHLV